MTTDNPLLADIRGILLKGDREHSLKSVLDRLLAHFQCVLGTIHILDSSNLLQLRAQAGLPEVLMEKVRVIPIGKGMAGLAAERRAPVQVCNLQTDNTGVAKPAAKETQMAGSIAVPMLVGDTLIGTLGIAKPTEYEFSKDEIALLAQAGTAIGESLR
jgi:transcriptional regulator with GAF, ATPase, and Fis domain